MTTQREIDLMSPAFKADPYPVYAELRPAAPVQRITMPDGHEVWLIISYEEAHRALRDDRLIKNARNALPAEQLAHLPPPPGEDALLSLNLLDLDPPDHTRLRVLGQKAFPPRLIERLRDRIQAITDQLLDAVAPTGRMDVIADFAALLPLAVITDVLGIPEADRPRVRAWLQRMVDATSLHELENAQEAAEAALVAYLVGLVAERRRAPREDFISVLVQVEEGGDRLRQSEILSMILVLMIAGYETTLTLLGNGMLALLRHPGQFALLKSDLALVPLAVEEMLRYDGPAETATPRFARTAITLGGVTIPRGAMVLVGLTAANRDPAQFPDPDRFDIRRTPNKHLAFGYGIHYCLGAVLARLEATIAFTTLIERLPNLRLDIDPARLAWRRNPILRGVESLPVAFDPAR